MTDTPNPYASPTADSIPLPGDRPLRTDFPEEFRKVRLGLSLVYYGICGILLAAISTPFVTALDPFAGVGVAGLMFALTIMMFVGQVLCIAAPRQTGAKGLATAAVVLQLVGWVANFGLAFVGAPVAVVAGSAIGALASVASLVCFALFLRQTARYLGEHAVAGRATRTLVVGAIAAALLGAGIAVAPDMGFGANGGQIPDTAAVAMMAIGGLMSLAAMLMYANTITYLRKAIKV